MIVKFCFFHFILRSEVDVFKVKCKYLPSEPVSGVHLSQQLLSHSIYNTITLSERLTCWNYMCAGPDTNCLHEKKKTHLTHLTRYTTEVTSKSK